MSYFTKLIDRLGNKPQVNTVEPKATDQAGPTAPADSGQRAAKQARP